MVSGFHHYHKRKRKTKIESNSFRSRLIKIIDNLIYIVVILGPLMTLPQVLKIWIEQNPLGVSIISWTAYLIGAVFWMIYGLIHKEKPIILANLLWMIFTFLIIVGVWIYG